MLQAKIQLKTLAALSIAFMGLIGTISSNAQNSTINKPEEIKGSTIVQIHADWCSTCKNQDAVFKKIMSNPANKEKYKSIKFYSINFDTQTKALKNFSARNQSTIISYNNKGVETLRTIGESSEEQLISSLDKAL
jgi:thioredoxin 1